MFAHEVSIAIHLGNIADRFKFQKYPLRVRLFGQIHRNAVPPGSPIVPMVLLFAKVPQFPPAGLNVQVIPGVRNGDGFPSIIV